MATGAPPSNLRTVDGSDSVSRSHLLALPALLRPISAELSALHAARVRLLVDLPPENRQGWCCAQCGHLSEGWGWRVVKGQNKKRKMSGGSTAQETNKRSKSDVAAQAPSSPGSSKPGTSKPRNKLKSRCSLCGLSASFAGSEPATVDSFPSARQAARRRTRASSAQEEPPIAAAATPVPSPASTKPQPPNLLKASPKLAHIPLSHPTPVTELPPPPVMNSNGGGGSSSSSSSSPAGTAKPKKRKKSGLQKLLAESAARKQDTGKAGDASSKLAAWGLG